MKASEKRKPAMPFPFVLEALQSRPIHIRPMFGCYAIYDGEKIVLILRDRHDHPFDNGVWIATTGEHHATLKAIFPHMRSVRVLGGKPTAWQNIPKTSPDFEESALRACELILKNDVRIGKFPKSRKGTTSPKKR